jgi:hypothetical protein
VSSWLLLTALAAACGEASCEPLASPQVAWEKVLAGAPLVLAVGEYHELSTGPKAKSAVKRFTEAMLPSLKGKAVSLVVETWITNGKCGEAEKKAVAEVKKTTQRPANTEDELETLLSRSYELGLKNHILTLDCDEYRSMVGADGELDAEKSLRMMRDKVEEKVLELRDKGESGVDGKLVVLYGGALHNDRYPAEDWKDFSFGATLAQRVGGEYVELDLLVPEYVEKDDELLATPWFKPAVALAAKGQAVLVTLRPGVFALVFSPGKARGKAR